MTCVADWINTQRLNEWQIQHIYRLLGATAFEHVPVMAVDGDIIAYHTAAVCEEEFEGSCNAIIDATLRNIATDTGISHMRIYLSGANNFRYGIAKTKPYKGNRDGFVRPRFLAHCKQYLVDKYSAIFIDGAEADDGIATDMVVNGAYHCGVDKDILQIAGKHYNYVKKEWQEVSDEDAIITLYRQVLMGDASDNIPGLPRVGEKTAEKFITSAETAAEDALETYKDVCADKLPEVNPIEYMAEQLNLIKMKTDITLDLTRTTYIEPKTEGFTAQDGEVIEDQEPTKEVTPPRL